MLDLHSSIKGQRLASFSTYPSRLCHSNRKSADRSWLMGLDSSGVKVESVDEVF